MALELRTLVSTCRGVGQDVVMCEHGAQGWLLTETKWPVAVFHCSVNHAPVFPSYVVILHYLKAGGLPMIRH